LDKNAESYSAESVLREFVNTLRVPRLVLIWALACVCSAITYLQLLPATWQRGMLNRGLFH